MTFPLFPALGTSVILGWSTTITPKFNVNVAKRTTGAELRAPAYSFAIYNCELTYQGLRSTAAFGELQTIAGFYNQMQGQYAPFWIALPGIFAAKDQPIAIGDGSTTTFQIRRTFGTYFEPVAVSTVLAVYLDGVPISGSDATVSGDYPASITFTSAPTSGVHITADFDQLWLARFSEDIISPSEFMSMLWELKTLKVETTRPSAGDTPPGPAPWPPSSPGLNGWVAVQMSNSGDDIFIGGSNGLWLSTNGGTSFAQADDDITWNIVGYNSIAISTDGSQLYASGAGDDDITDIYTSTDNGGTWSDLTTGSVASGINDQGIVVSSDKSTIVFVGASVDDIFTSADFGSTWSKIITGISIGGYDIIAGSSTLGTLIAKTNFTDLLLSTDGGVTWTAPTIGGYVFDALYSSPNGLLLAGVQPASFSGQEIAISTDGGTTWGVQTGPATTPAAICGFSDDSLYLAGADEAIYASYNSGVSWAELTGSPAINYTSVACSSDGTAICGVSDLQGVWVSHDSGATWVRKVIE